MRNAILGTMVAGLGVLSMPMASAHSELLRADPGPNGALRTRPATVALHFTEDIDLTQSSIDVLAGTRRLAVTPLAHIGADAATLTGVVPAAAANGAITVVWKSVSTDDGHVQTGSYGLTLDLPPGAAAPAGPSVPSAPDTAGVSWLFGFVRMLSYLAMALLCGGLAFLVLVWPAGADVRRSRVLLWGAWTAGLVSTLLGIALEGAYANQSGLGSVWDQAQLGGTLATHYGTVWAIRALLFVLAFPALLQLSRSGSRVVRTTPWLLGTGAVLIALLRTPGLVAHTAEGRWAWLGSVADLVHLTGVAVWIGGLGLLCLVVLPRRRPDELEQVVPRFSKVAAASIAAIVVAGAFMSWQVVGGLHALMHTHFGNVLLVKLGFFAAALLAAFGSKTWADRRLTWAVVTGGDGHVTRPFAVYVFAETLVAVGIVTVASILVNTSPGR